ncbi:hypothetical protein KC19_1G124800 [Ceratodon purpureus]|uniref:Uncharacterized protein n=1 Tax=Ceratodon purpureus TaxID=3225 RepID=A0A8T0J593_CERPU|nr:hypothetical protein KC19_1G124800 [Ceratodon purpureus]
METSHTISDLGRNLYNPEPTVARFRRPRPKPYTVHVRESMTSRESATTRSQANQANLAAGNKDRGLVTGAGQGTVRRALRLRGSGDDAGNLGEGAASEHEFWVVWCVERRVRMRLIGGSTCADSELQ